MLQFRHGSRKVMKRRSLNEIHPLIMRYWFSTQDAGDRQEEQFSVTGGLTDLNSTKTLTIKKTLSNGTDLSLQTGYDSEVNIRPRTFHSDQYSLLMKIQISRVWIDFPDT